MGLRKLTNSPIDESPNHQIARSPTPAEIRQKLYSTPNIGVTAVAVIVQLEQNVAGHEQLVGEHRLHANRSAHRVERLGLEADVREHRFVVEGVKGLRLQALSVDRVVPERRTRA